MLKCNQCHNHLMRYFDHVLSQTEIDDLYQHLDSCKTCHQKFTELQTIMASLENSPMVEPPLVLEEAILNRIHACAQSSLPVSTDQTDYGLTRLIYGSLTAIMAILVIISTLYWKDTGFFDFILEGRRILYSITTTVMNLQIIYQVSSGLFASALIAVLRQIQTVYVTVILITVCLTIKTALSKMFKTGLL